MGHKAEGPEISNWLKKLDIFRLGRDPEEMRSDLKYLKSCEVKRSSCVLCPFRELNKGPKGEGPQNLGLYNSGFPCPQRLPVMEWLVCERVSSPSKPCFLFLKILFIYF